MQTQDLGKIFYRRYAGMNGDGFTLISEKELEIDKELTYANQTNDKPCIKALEKELRECQRLQKVIMRGKRIYRGEVIDL